MFYRARSSKGESSKDTHRGSDLSCMVMREASVESEKTGGGLAISGFQFFRGKRTWIEKPNRTREKTAHTTWVIRLSTISKKGVV